MMRLNQVAWGMFATLYLSAAQAALGGLERDVIQEGKPAPSSSAHAYGALPQSIHQQTILDPRSTTVTEFSSAGVVFALSWSGPTIPDYQVLLATYFPQYQQAMQSLKPTPGHYRAPVAVHQPHLVLHASGHMGAYQGSMYDPALIPAGISLASLGIGP